MAKKKQEKTRRGKRRESLAQQFLRSIHRQKLLHAGERVGVAVSGGGDSVALLLLLEELRERLGVVLAVAHFNHQLRGRSSDADERFAARLAAQRGLAFHLERGRVAAEAKRSRSNVEDAARRMRYAFFERLVSEGQVDRIAVAHTADDQAETVLAHILRGTGLAGLGGIHPTAGHVVRPLLGFRRAELRRFLRERKQPWREDATNLDVTRLRARIRRKLMPLLEKKFQPAAVEHLAQLAELAREDEAFLEAMAGETAAMLAREDETSVRIHAQDLAHPWKRAGGGAESSTGEESRRDVEVALSKRVIRKLLERVKRQPGQFNAQHVQVVLELARSGHSGSVLQLPGGVDVERNLEEIVFCARGDSAFVVGGNKPAKRSFEYGVNISERGAAVRVVELGCVFRLRVIDWPPKRGETILRAAVLDRNRLVEPIVLRNWRPGDAYRPEGHQRPHKLKRLFLEKRISRRERETWPVLTSGGAIVWARGFPVAAEFAPDARTQAGLVIAEEGL